MVAIKHGFPIARKGKNASKLITCKNPEKKTNKPKTPHSRTDMCYHKLSVASLFWVKEGQAVKEKRLLSWSGLAVKQRQAFTRCHEDMP